MVLKMKRYINEIPLVVKNSIKALSDEKRQNILIYLLRTGSKSFTDISKDLSLSKNNLSHHIKTLMRYGLVYNFYNRNEFVDKYSFYEISKLGKVIITNLINLVIPLRSEEEILLDTIMDKAITEKFFTDVDSSEVSSWTEIPTEAKMGSYKISLIDAGEGLEIPFKKSLEDESNLNILSY